MESSEDKYRPLVLAAFETVELTCILCSIEKRQGLREGALARCASNCAGLRLREAMEDIGEIEPMWTKGKEGRDE